MPRNSVSLPLRRRKSLIQAGFWVFTCEENFSSWDCETLAKVGTTIVPIWSPSRLGTPAFSKAISNKKSLDSFSLAKLAAQQAEEKKAAGTLVLEVGQITPLADFFVITGGDSVNQVNAIADAIVDALESAGHKCLASEGKKEGRWVLLDFGTIIVHVLKEQERNYYKLEQFWNQALVVDRSSWESR